MAHVMEDLLKSDDVVVMDRGAYENLKNTITLQNKEIRSLEYRIKTLLSGDK